MNQKKIIENRRDTTVAASHAAAAASEALAATPACVPRGALLYASDAPRPLPALRAGECKKQEHHAYAGQSFHPIVAST